MAEGWGGAFAPCTYGIPYTYVVLYIVLYVLLTLVDFKGTLPELFRLGWIAVAIWH
jgi:hypothetical protein